MLPIEVNKFQNKTAEYFNYRGDYFHLKCSHNRSLRNGNKKATQSHNNGFPQLFLDKTFLGHAV